MGSGCNGTLPVEAYEGNYYGKGGGQIYVNVGRLVVSGEKSRISANGFSSGNTYLDIELMNPKMLCEDPTVDFEDKN
jgi:hypothetical protein